MDRFPHLDDTNFPLTTPVDAYDYENDYDYERFDADQMEITLCRVPWDVGNVHVGNSVIPGLGNVVYFEGGEEERNAFFDEIPANEKYVWRTKFSNFHSEGKIRLPVPFDMLAEYNYVYIKYRETPNATNPIDYEGPGGIKRWFYFIREMNRLAPNTTEVIMLRDSWQTFIYSVDIPYIRLERGHYGVAKSSATKYLTNPKENGDWVLGDDETFGEGEVINQTVTRILNDGDMYAVIFTWANPQGSWGTAQADSWATPAANYPHQDGVTAPYAFACPCTQFDVHMAALFSNVPQFVRTVLGIAFIPRKCLNLGNSFNFASASWYPVSSSQKTLNPVKVNELDFGIPEEYKHLAKMYTAPYSWIEVTDFCGNSRVIKIEETTGVLDFKVCANLAFPYLNYEFTVNGIGGESSAFNFYQITQRNFTAGGRWYEYIFENKIPVFALAESGAQANRYAQWWNRDAQENQARTTNTNTKQSNATAQSNAHASANTAETNANASNLASYTNAKASNATAEANTKASANTARSNSRRSALTAETVAHDSADTENANAKRSATASQNNANASATTAYNNAINSAASSRTTTKRSAATAKTNAHAAADTTRTNIDVVNSGDWANTVTATANAAKDTNYANQLSVAQLYYTLGYNKQTTNNEQEAASASAVVGAVGGVANSALGGFMSGGLAGAAAGLVSGGISAVTSGVQTAIQNNLLELQAAAYETYQLAIQSATTTNNTQRTEDIANVRAETQQKNSNDARSTQGDNNQKTSKANANRDKKTADTNADTTYNAAETNATNQQTTDKANAARSYNAAVKNASATRATTRANATAIKGANYDNADATRTTAHSNAEDLRTTNDANAKRTYDATADNIARDKTTAIANADRVKSTGDANADRSLAAALYNVKAQRQDQQLDAPYVHGSVSDAEDATVKPEGLLVNACRQPDGLIRQVGDYFLRFGYAANRSLNFETFNVMPRFSFWKCADISIRSVQLADAYLDDIRFLLLGGVTIWKRPEDIQQYSIYENR